MFYKWIAGDPIKQIPLYQSRKEIRAFRIRDIKGNVWQPDDDRYGLQELDVDYVAKYKPKPGDYYIVFEDGKESFCAGEFFEDVWTRIATCTCAGNPGFACKGEFIP